MVWNSGKLNYIQKRLRRKNVYPLKGMQREKVIVARDDVGSAAAHCDFEKFVVCGIATNRNGGCNDDPFALSDECGQEAACLFHRDVRTESFSSQYLM